MRHSVINHRECDRHIILLSDTDLYLLACLIYLLILICLLGDSNIFNEKEILRIYIYIYMLHCFYVFNKTKGISKSTRWVICLLSITVIHHAICLWLYRINIYHYYYRQYRFIKWKYLFPYISTSEFYRWLSECPS